MRVTSVSAVLSLGLDVMKRDISETTRRRHYYILLCIMYATLRPGVRAGRAAVREDVWRHKKGRRNQTKEERRGNIRTSVREMEGR